MQFTHERRGGNNHVQDGVPTIVGEAPKKRTHVKCQTRPLTKHLSTEGTGPRRNDVVFYRDSCLTVATQCGATFRYELVAIIIRNRRHVTMSFIESGEQTVYQGAISGDGIIRLIRSDGSIGTFVHVEADRWAGVWSEHDNHRGTWELILEDIEETELRA